VLPCISASACTAPVTLAWARLNLTSQLYGAVDETKTMGISAKILWHDGCRR
jgi:hypothetical protein